jgi:hypothetical protein
MEKKKRWGAAFPPPSAGSPPFFSLFCYVKAPGRVRGATVKVRMSSVLSLQSADMPFPSPLHVHTRRGVPVSRMACLCAVLSMCINFTILCSPISFFPYCRSDFARRDSRLFFFFFGVALFLSFSWHLGRVGHIHTYTRREETKHGCHSS